MELRTYQIDAIDDALQFVERALADPSAPRRRLYSAMMGTGKSIIQKTIAAELAPFADPGDVRIIVPTPEIGLSAFPSYEWSTPYRHRKGLLEGTEKPATVYIEDEAHHTTMDTAQDYAAIAGPRAIHLGFTATPYRGSPKETQALRELWGPPHPILSVRQAIAGNWAALPSVRIVPLIDDDNIETANGEFVASKVESATMDNLDRIAEIISYDVPTMVAVSTVETAKALAERIGARAALVTGETNRKDRDIAYARVERGEAVLIQIAVVGEGVDLPWLRRLIDIRPTMSPVAWFQLVGRICRPGPIRPEYVGCCRNFSRHAYLFDGMYPPEAFAAEEKAFDGPSKRQGIRFMGMEAVSRFKCLPVPLKNGTQGGMYILERGDFSGREHWCIIYAPHKAQPVVAKRESKEGDWGKWQLATPPADFSGFATSQYRMKATDKQRAVWKRLAERVGLNPDASDKLAGRDIASLFVLLDTNERL